jgi:hypothetical protein
MTADPQPSDVMDEALALIEGARVRDVPLRLVGGLAVRYLTPGYPPRSRDRQDLDLASVSRARRELTDFLIELGHEPDKRFNALYGHKQLFFSSPAGRAIDVLIDRMEMCHELAFSERIDRLPVTLDVTDLLLTKLQIVELNQKDAQDILYLLSAFAVAEGDEPGTIGLDRIARVVADDWGWWRTITMNLDRIEELVRSDGAHLVPAGAAHDPAGQLAGLRRAADETPKTRRWRLRAKIGDRRRWYRIPDEDSHD